MSDIPCGSCDGRGTIEDDSMRGEAGCMTCLGTGKDLWGVMDPEERAIAWGGDWSDYKAVQEESHADD